MQFKLQIVRMESFFRTHRYLLEHLNAPVRRDLMDEIDWSCRLIGIKGTRGVGKTTFLLQYAKEKFGYDRSCLYINMNNLYFQGRGIAEFAGDFQKMGGKVLLIDQVFKHPDWSEELRLCYDLYPNLKIVFTGSSVMRLKEENHSLNGIVKSYNLRGFSFREYMNLKAGTTIPVCTLNDILKNHQEIAKQINQHVKPEIYFQDYLHHGFYPFFMEKTSFSENLLKTMSMMIEVDILLLKQVELKYLSKIKKLFYLLAIGGTSAPNVSQLAKAIDTSRATVMNYIKYLADARLINIVYDKDESFPKKPCRVLMHNTNLIYTIYPPKSDRKEVIDTFFVNSMWKDHSVNRGKKDNTFLVDCELEFKLQQKGNITKNNPDWFYVVDNMNEGKDNVIPLWMFGLLY